MQRPDGSVIDYATVALPEGMTMLTFVDVTDSARIQRVLTRAERGAGGGRPAEVRLHPARLLRAALAAAPPSSAFPSCSPNETAGGLNPQQREYMDHIDSSSRALLALINDILDLATVDAGIMSLDIREADIAAVARSAVEGLRDRLAEQKIELEMAIPKDIGTFYVDEQRVRQILFNLVSNAIRFSNAGGHIRVAAAREDGSVVLHRHRRRRRHSART